MKKIQILIFSTILSCSTLPKGFSPIAPESNIIEKKDLVENRNIYTHSDLVGLFKPKPLHMYVITKDKNKWLRIVFTYTGTDWIFFEKMFLSGKEERIEFSIENYDKFTNVASDASITEKADILIDKSEIKTLKNLFAKPFTLRLRGKYQRDFDYDNCISCLELINYYDSLK
ncbi:hypothetical protein [Leptospira brenneri]|uniref:hypothetical protein n=1 Tax=Leptospira brenneri TaxID=2023182 RepID=UPI000C2A2CA1|nr:hypothetical protein [Leptospira brenneri]PJZ43787.1 hypothetical protein CH361_18720 [Leptospira brenneri]